MRNYQIILERTDLKKISTTLPFSTPKAIKAYCQHHAFKLLSVRQRTGKRNTLPKRAFTPQALYRFTQTLCDLLSADFSMMAALKLAQASLPTHQRSLFETLRQQMVQGHTFSEALALFKDHLPAFYIPCIDAGESSGKLIEALQRIAKSLKSQCEFRTALKRALSYPLVLLGFAMLTLAFLLFSVLPSFESIYRSTQTPLPNMTRQLCQLAHQITHAPMIAALIFLSTILATYWVCTKTPLSQLHHREHALSDWSQILLLQLKSHVPLTRALSHANHTHFPKNIKKALLSAETALRSGEALNHVLEKTHLFPEIILKRIALGTSTGDLVKTFAFVAHHYQQQHKNRLRRLSQWAEPVMMIGIAVLIGFFVVALYLPLFNLGLAIK